MLKCTELEFGWSSVSDSTGRAHSIPSDIDMDLWGPTFTCVEL